MHEKPTYTCCIYENTLMAYLRAYFGVAFETLVQMDFMQINARCINSNNITYSCHVHASYCCICLCIDCWHRSFSIGLAPELFQSTCLWSSASSVDLPGKQTPLFIPIQSYSLAPALSYCIRTTTIHLLLCAAVVEPIPLHNLSLPQIGRASCRERV